MTKEPRLADLGPLWTEMIDGLADMQAGLLRRLGDRLADQLDQQARVEVEGATGWRNMGARRNIYEAAND